MAKVNLRVYVLSSPLWASSQTNMAVSRTNGKHMTAHHQISGTHHNAIQTTIPMHNVRVSTYTKLKQKTNAALTFWPRNEARAIVQKIF